VLGLVRLDEGSVRIWGHRVPHELPQVIERVGALIDAPRFNGAFSARQRLRLLALDRRLPATRVEAVLETVGLTDRAADPVRKYSLGMRQRLGVATALLGSPRLLLLDEPVNGLDPLGLREMRNLLLRLRDEGVTIVLSSHLLSEIEEVCSRVAVFANGRVVHHGDLSALRGTPAERCALVRVQPVDAAAGALRARGWDVELVGRSQLRVRLGDHSPAEINRCLATGKLFASELVEERRSLETAFLELVAPEPTNDRPAR
jgi:ABC-2 type transport system ATP-binding protein